MKGIWVYIIIGILVLSVAYSEFSSSSINWLGKEQGDFLYAPRNAIEGQIHYHNDDAAGFTVVIPAQNVWVNITGFNNPLNELANFTDGMTFDPQEEGLRCITSGRYFSIYFISFGNDGNNEEYQFQLAVDNERQHITDIHRKIGSAGDVGSATSGGTINCLAGQLIQLQAIDVENSQDLEIHSVTVHVQNNGDVIPG